MLKSVTTLMAVGEVDLDEKGTYEMLAVGAVAGAPVVNVWSAP